MTPPIKSKLIRSKRELLEANYRGLIQQQMDQNLKAIKLGERLCSRCGVHKCSAGVTSMDEPIGLCAPCVNDAIRWWASYPERSVER